MDDFSLSRLSDKDQAYFQSVFSGKASPAIHSDIIAKNVLNPDVHPDRMNFLLRSLAKDSTIEVKSSAANEEFKQSQYSKTMITDIPSWLTDARIADLEMQKAAQDFIFTRTELYGSDMLLLQYSVEENQAKAELQYSSIKEAIIAVLMVESPKALKDFQSERYIHRVTDRVADSGFRYPSKVKLIFVQLDKCLEQFKRGVDGEKDGKLQLWLATIADPNDEQVKSKAEKDEVLRSMMQEAFLMGQDKEVQRMLIKEKYDQMDWLSYGSQQREEGANQQANTTAEKMLRKNKPLSEIVDFSGLTEAAVRALAEKLKLTVVAG